MSKRSIFLTLALAATQVLAFAQAGFQLPKYEKVKLKNGLTLYLMEQHEVPLISFNLTFSAGAAYDGAMPGLASITGEALRLGTAKYSKDQIDEQIDFLGATLDIATGSEFATVFGEFAAKDQDAVWPILADMVQAPRFDAAEFDKARTRKVQNLIQAKDSPREVIGDYWNGFMYPGHPYGNPTEGDEKSVAKIQVADAQAFFKAHYTAGNAAIAVVGDFKAADMKARITQLLGDWKTEKPAAAITKVPTQEYGKARVVLVNKEDSHESRFFIGGKGVPRNHPDYVAIQVINTILGGRFTSWLNTELRINSGLSYGARSNFDYRRLSGTFYVGSFTATETTERAMRMAGRVLDSLHRVGPDEATLASARNYILGGFAPDYETASQLAGLLTDFHNYGINETAINTFRDQVMAVDLARAKEIIRKYFPKDNLQVLVIGRGEDVRAALKAWGEYKEKDIRDAGY
jgi:predicted Zn-dependent peptidase